MPRYFTHRQAEQLLPEVESAIRDAISLKSEYEDAEAEWQGFSRRVTLMGGMPVDHSKVLEQKKRRESTAHGLKEVLERIQDYGCVVKDLDVGLIDFPTLLRGEGSICAGNWASPASVSGMGSAKALAGASPSTGNSSTTIKANCLIECARIGNGRNGWLPSLRSMLLSREFITYLSRHLVMRMTPQIIETSDPNAAVEMISHLIEDELAVEDRLNDEVRELLSQYSDYMRREGVSYQEMFRRIKNTLISQRKVIRAAGRDTGDNMKLSRDKVNDISHKLVGAFRKAREFRLKKDPNDVRLEIVRSMTELLGVEEKVDRAARTKIRSQKKEIPEGSEEWDLLHRRYYAEELKKFGIDLNR
jgi:hypothetical protein